MDVAIIGAGPAGMSCANAALTFGLTPLLIERTNHLGGAQRINFHPNLWLLGTPGETGAEMTERMARHFQELPIETRRLTAVLDAHRTRNGFQLALQSEAGDSEIETRAIVLATGTRPFATPGLLALAQASERVIIGPLSFAIRDHIRDSRVLILGGGDNALDHALFLAERGNAVQVCTRHGFSARHQFVENCRKWPRISLSTQCVPEALEAQGDRVAMKWKGGTQAYDWLLVMYGYRPNVEILERFADDMRPRLTPSGHIDVDLWQRTSVPGLYAAGDLTASPQPSVSTAIAQGLTAAKAVERYLHDLPA